MQLLFIHIPKTAGSYFSRLYDKKIIYGAHTFCISYQNQPKYLNNYILHNDHIKWTNGRGIPNIIDGIYSPKLTKNHHVITIIRNPYDMLCSLYFHDKGNGFGACNHKDSIKHIKTFKEFIIKYCSDDWNWMGGFPCPYLKKNLFQQIFDETGKCMADIIIIYERLDEGIAYLKKERNIIPVINPNQIVRKSVYKNKNYKDYYDEEMIEMVKKKCKIELEMFNYNFYGYRGIKSVIFPKIKSL